MEGSSIPETLREAQSGIEKLKRSKFETKVEDKQHFETVQHAFKVMRANNNDYLPQYVSLMKDVLEFIMTPLYHNFFGERKLTHNLVKRCLIRPFCDKLMFQEEGQQPQVFKLRNNSDAVQKINESMAYFTKEELRTDFLMMTLHPYLNAYIIFIEKDDTLREKFSNDLHILKSLRKDCADTISYDYYDKSKFFDQFQGKQPLLIGKYIKILNGLHNKFYQDKNLKKKLFNND